MIICRNMKLLNLTIRRFISNGSISNGGGFQIFGGKSGYKTNLQIYHSSIKRKAQLFTKENGIVSWYCCGPTVYDSAHIGHACCYIRFDVIRRIMEELFSQNVIMVMGITDIDDKIINRAKQEGVDFRKISRYYEEEFFKDMYQLNIKKPNVIARVSDYIQEIISFIQNIIDSGYGYVTSDGSVNFSVEKYGGYGIFVGAQEEFNFDPVQKKSSRDFAMWKSAKPNEPSWPSPWGEGRPGWHIECSAIASKLLGNSLDIHSGGIDLKFPHHENEEAQCCVHHNIKSWVTCWMHSGHVYLSNTEKMSKSLKNTISINHFLKKYSSDHLRMLCLMVPYRNGIEYGDKVMENAVSVYKKFRNFINDCDAIMKGSKPLASFDESALLKDLNETRAAVLNCLANDFDTSSAVSRIIQFITAANLAFNQSMDNVTETRSCFGVVAACAFVEDFLSICGFKLSNAIIRDHTYTDISSIMEAALLLRSEVRNLALKMNQKSEITDMKSSLLTVCDKFRENIHLSGIELKDSGSKTSWNFTELKKSF